MKTHVFYIILEFLSLHYHISSSFVQYPKDFFPDTESEKDDEIPNWEYEPFYEEFHKFPHSKQAELPAKSDTRFTQPIRKKTSKTTDNGNPNALYDDRLSGNEAIPGSEKLYPSDPGESNPPYGLSRNMKRPISIENDEEGHLAKPNMKHNYYYYEEAYPKHSHDRNNKFRIGIKKHKHMKSYDNYMQDREQQHYVKEPLSYLVKKESMRPSKRLIHEIKVVEIANDMKNDGKPLNIPKRDVEESDDGNLEDESDNLSLKARNSENFSTSHSFLSVLDPNHIYPTKRTLSFPNVDKSIHARLIEVFQEPPHKSENDQTDQKRGIFSRTLDNPDGKSKDLQNLLNILTGGVGNEDSLKPANEETEINIVMRRTVRENDFKVGKNSSAYYGSVTHWKEDADKQEKISKPDGNNVTPADSSDESQELRKKRNKSSRQLHSMYLVGPKGWKSFSKVSKRSHTESPRSLKLTTTGNIGNKTFDYEEDLSEKIKDFIHRHYQNISDNESVDVDSNETKVIEVGEETLPERNLTDVIKKEKLIRLEEKTYHSLEKPEPYKSPLSDVIEIPAMKVVTSTILSEPSENNKNIGIENLLTDLTNEQSISPELQLLIEALNLHKGKSTLPSNILTTNSGVTTNGAISVSTTVKHLQMDQTSNSLSTETTAPPKNDSEWGLSNIGSFLLNSIGLGTQTTETTTYHEEIGSSPKSLLKSNISSPSNLNLLNLNPPSLSKALQTPKTKDGSNFQATQRTETTTYLEENGSSPKSLLKSNIPSPSNLNLLNLNPPSLSKALQTPKTKDGSNFQATQTPETTTFHEEIGSSPESLLKSNISSPSNLNLLNRRPPSFSKALQTPKTKGGSKFQATKKPKRKKLKKKIRTTKVLSALPTIKTKGPSRLTYYGSKPHKKILSNARKPPKTTSADLWKHKIGRTTTAIPKVGTVCKYCSKEIKIIDTSVEIPQTSGDVPVISHNNNYKVFLENDVEWVTSSVKNVPREAENDEMETYTIAEKIFQLTTEDLFKNGSIIFDKVFMRNPQSQPINNLEDPGKADIASPSLWETESPSKLQRNEYSVDGHKSINVDESNPELYKSPDKPVELNKRNFELPKSNVDNLAKNVSENGKLTVNELISRNVILTDLLSLLNKKDATKKDLNDHTTSQNDRPKFFNLSGKHPYLAGFILGVGLVIIFLIFSIILYWMGFKKGQYDYYAKETEKEPETAMHLLPRDERRGTIAGNHNVFFANNGEESTDMKTLKHLIAKASTMQAEDPIKEDVTLLKKRVMNNENGVKSSKEVIPTKSSSSMNLHHRSFRNSRKSRSFEPKLNSMITNDGSDDERWNGNFDKNRKPTLEILADIGSARKFKSPYRN